MNPIDRPYLVQHFLEHSANRLPDKVALICGDEQLTYKEINERANRLAGALVEMGVERQDRVAIFLDSSVESVISLFGVLKAGAIFIMLSPTLKPKKLIYILNDSGSKILISHKNKASVVNKASSDAPKLAHVIWTGIYDTSNTPRTITKMDKSFQHRCWETALSRPCAVPTQFNSSMKLSESLGYRISAESFDSDNYRDHNEEENTNFSGMLEYERADNSFFVQFQQIDNKLELPGALLEDEFKDDPTQTNPGFVNDFRDEEISVIRLGYARDLGSHRFSIDATQRETEADILQSFRDFPSPEAGFDDRENNSINPKLSGILNAGVEIPYVVGIDLEETDYELEIPFDFFGPGLQTASNEQDTESLYLQVNPKLTDRLQLTFGMRHSSVENDMTDGFSFPDGIEVDDDVSVGELGLAYQVDNQTRLRLRYDQNFRFAKVNELAQAAPGNILDTQTGDSFEIGIDLTRGDHQLILSIYRLDLEDEIEFDPDAGMFGENVNLEDTRRDGLTVSLYSQLSMAFGLKTEIGIVDAEFRSGSFEGKEISGVADAIASLRGDYRISDQFSTYLEYHYSSPKYAQGDNANDFGKLGSITVYNAGIAYQYKVWDVNFRINNLADESYAEFVTNNGAYYPSPERNYTLTATYRFE